MPISFKCPGCGAPIMDNPDSSVLVCNRCGNTVTKYIQQTNNLNVNVSGHAVVENIHRDITAEKQAKGKTKGEVVRLITKIVPFIFVLALVLMQRSCANDNVRRGLEQNQKLEALVIEIETDILNGDYDSALLKTNRLRWDGGSYEADYTRWEKQRTDLEEKIEEIRNNGN